MKKASIWLGLTLLSGILLKLGSPPFHIGGLVLFSWVPVLLLMPHFRVFMLGISGFIVGLFWTADLPLALIKWGWPLAFFSWLLAGIWLGSILSLSAFIYQRLSGPLQVLAFPMMISIGIYFGQISALAPLALSPALVDFLPSLFTLGPYLGFYGLEFFIALTNSLIAYALLRGVPHRLLATPNTEATIKARPRQSIFVSSLFAVGCFGAAAYDFFRHEPNAAVQERNTIDIIGIQPAISHRKALRAGSSLHDRWENEDRLDQLTALAIQRSREQHSDQALIVWPEGGHNQSNLLLTRRREKLAALIGDSNSELLLGAYEYQGAMAKVNSVSLYNKTGFVKTVAKAKPAPIAESHIGKGRADIIQSRNAKLGIAICYEAIFDAHFSALKRLGAEIFVVVTDDSSFGKTELYRRHINYARVYAAIYQTPLVFLNNYGNSYLVGTRGEILQHDENGTRPHLIQWQSTLAGKDQTSFLSLQRFIQIFILLLGLSILARCLIAQRLDKEMRLPKRSNAGANPLLVFSVSSCLLLTPLILFFDIKSLALKRQISTSVLLSESLQRYRGEPALDGIAPLFRQQEKTSCGASALAYALTHMGDKIFEFDILRGHPPLKANGYSLQELQTIAQSRGFKAKAYAGQVDDLSNATPLPSIAHWKNEHYVVVLKITEDDIVYFDPAFGQVFHQSRQKFDDQWTGVLLAILYDDNWFIDKPNQHKNSYKNEYLSATNME